VGRVSEINDTSVTGRVYKVQQEYTAKQTRFFVRFAVIEALLMVPVIAVAFVFELIDSQIGIWILLAIAGGSGLILVTTLMRLMREREAAINQARGINPLI